MANQTYRVIELIKRLSNDETICIDALECDPMWEGKNEKTIRRDLDIIKELFPDSFTNIRAPKGERGCYRAITKDFYNDFANKELIALIVQTFNIAQRSNLFDSFNISSEDRRILEKKIKESQAAYEFKNKPFESKKDDHIIFKNLEDAIKRQRYISVEYDEKSGTKSYLFKPYKIVFMNENFYVAGIIDKSEFEFSLFRISNIQSIKLESKTFQKNPDLEDFIKEMQTPFAKYSQGFRSKLIDIKIEVSATKADYFKKKKFLPSQKEDITPQESGNLIVTYKVTSEMEVEELIKRWLPHVKVLEPLSLKTKIAQELQEYLANG